MNNVYYNFVIVGCGGTGGNFAGKLAQFISTAGTCCSICLVDGDLVEESNISRQPFCYSDLMCNKAAALSEAIADVYGIEPFVYPHYLDCNQDLDKVFNLLPKGTVYHDGNRLNIVNVLVGCCDNHRCRQIMERWFKKQQNAIYLDSANEFSVGEVVIGIKANEKTAAPSRAYYYPEIMKSRVKRKSEESCGAVNLSSPQHLATNMTAACILLSLVSNMVQGNGLKGGIVYFDTFAFSQVFREWKGEQL